MSPLKRSPAGVGVPTVWPKDGGEENISRTDVFDTFVGVLARDGSPEGDEFSIHATICLTDAPGPFFLLCVFKSSPPPPPPNNAPPPPPSGMPPRILPRSGARHNRTRSRPQTPKVIRARRRPPPQIRREAARLPGQRVLAVQHARLRSSSRKRRAFVRRDVVK